MLTHNLLPMSPNICYPCPSPYTPFGKGEIFTTLLGTSLPFEKGVRGDQSLGIQNPKHLFLRWIAESESPVHFDSEDLPRRSIAVSYEAVFSCEADEIDENLYILPAVVRNQLNLPFLPPLK